MPFRMLTRDSRLRLSLFVALSWMTLCATPVKAADWQFNVQFSEQVHPRPFSGRVYLAFTKSQKPPRLAPGNWFRPEPFVAIDVVDWQPGETLTFSAAEPGTMLAYPVPLAEMELAGLRAQAIARFNPWEREVGSGAGNGYSPVVEVEQSAAQGQPAAFVIDKLVEAPEFKETRWIKLFELRSSLLSEFHDRNVIMHAAVLLPASYYDEPQRRYPTVFIVPGFGGTHFRALRSEKPAEPTVDGVEFIRVMLDPSCPLGHHVFADSANNGPWGQALIEELIPEFDRRFRSVASPSARFLTGHSSGGWSSLWLQVTYPDDFGGTWSTAPDPVDFRDFQQIDLYRGENMYVDADGERRPLARSGERVLLWYKDFAQQEWVLGPGGQLHSFEAVFSPRDPSGHPQLLWDRETGEVDLDVARSWEAYDIRLILERNWSTLAPKLQGKVHVFMGDLDTFYLDGATVLLKETLERLGSDAVVEIHPGKNHGSLLTPELRERIRDEMAAAFLKAFPQAAQ